MRAENFKIGMSSFSTNRINRETFEAYQKAGIEYIEISLPAPLYPSINFKETAALSAETGVKIWSFHLPFSPYQSINIAAADKSLRKSTVELQGEYIRRAGDIGIKIAVIHPSSGPNEDDIRENLIENSMDSLFSLAQTAKESGVTLAVENLPRVGLGRCSKELKKIISADSSLRVCFDTNHLLDEHYSDFLPEFKNMIVNIHVSDYDFLNERHWMPFEGKINWVQMVELLEDTGYDGPFMYEVCLEALPSINRRKLTFDDFVENYRACISKRTLAPIGTPNTEVCLSNAYYKKPVVKPE